MAKTQPAMATVSRLASSVLRQSYAAKQNGVRLGDHYSKELVDDIFACALKKQTGVSLKYMCANLSSNLLFPVLRAKVNKDVVVREDLTSVILPNHDRVAFGSMKRVVTGIILDVYSIF